MFVCVCCVQPPYIQTGKQQHVRIAPGSTVVEVEEPLLDRARRALPELQTVLSGFDFVQGLVALAPFRSGSVAGR